MQEQDICLIEIGKRIIERRKKLGLTQETLAEKGSTPLRNAPVISLVFTTG